MISLENLKIGTYGWKQDSKTSSFYPEDLPEDWQLDYFSNAFRVVLVPQTQWLNWSEEALHDVMDSVEGDFEFYFAVQEGLNATKLEQLKRVVSVLGKRASGVVLWSEVAFTDLSIQSLPVTLISSHYCLPGWKWQSDAMWLSGHPLGFVSQLSVDGKVQATLLKAFMASLSSEEKKGVSHLAVPFIVGGIEGGVKEHVKVDMQQVVNLKTVGELLGY